MTPVKSSHPSRPRISEIGKVSENTNPNLSFQSPSKKPSNSPVIGSVKSKKQAPKTPIRIGSSQSRTTQGRKSVIAKKIAQHEAPTTVVCKCQEKTGKFKKCACIAFESLPPSQVDDLRETKGEKSSGRREIQEDQESRTAEGSEGKDIEGFGSFENASEIHDPEETEFSSEAGRSKARIRRNRMLDEARCSFPDLASGKVKNLVKAFESILSFTNSSTLNNKEGSEEEEGNKVMKWALPGLHNKTAETEDSPSSFSLLGFQAKATGTEVSSSPFSRGDLFFASKNSDMDSGVSSSIDSSSHGSSGSRTSGGGRRSRRNSSESSGKDSGRKWEKQLRVTSQMPFKLRTEQRGRFKKEEFHKKVEEMVMEEKKQRIPIAQGLPWTTDEPECLMKPLVKESTAPFDWVLHSDVRAVERAEFDHHVAEKLSFIEQYRLARERQQKLEEEEEIKKLRRELVPKAQPMPYFDRPFIPKTKRSLKHPTIPKEPRFHIPHQKKIK